MVNVHGVENYIYIFVNILIEATYFYLCVRMCGSGCVCGGGVD